MKLAVASQVALFLVGLSLLFVAQHQGWVCTPVKVAGWTQSSDGTWVNEALELQQRGMRACDED